MKCTIDGKEYEFKAGETIIQVADRNGVEIPRFCYHPALSVVAQCRMCAVEVEKMPKMQTACSTPAADGMVVHTKSDKAKQMQSTVMEFLLTNHPLDCPICDEAGECELQDYSFKYGTRDTRYDEMKRTYMDLDMGPVIKKNMNRCIHCTRCIRFCDEVSGYREMVALKRGNSTEIVTVDGAPLKTQYAGNLADICPTGSLTVKDFRFKKRAWFLKKTKSICEGCSQGCNIEVHHDNGKVFRTLPRENMDINKWWICDEGRFNFHYVHAEDRVVEPAVKDANGLTASDWSSATQAAKSILTGKILVLIGNDLTIEEMKQIQSWSSDYFKGATLMHYGTPNISSTSGDADEDKILRRTNKTSNLHGAEKLGLKGWDGTSSLDKFDSIIVFRGGRAMALPEIHKKASKGVVGVGVFNKNAVANYDVILPGLSFVEKSGTIVNWQGKEQKISKAIEPIGQSRAVSEIFGYWISEQAEQTEKVAGGF